MTTTPTFHLADFIDAAGSGPEGKPLQLDASETSTQTLLDPVDSGATTRDESLEQEVERVSAQWEEELNRNHDLQARVQQLEEQLRVREADVLELRGLVRTVVGNVSHEVAEIVRRLGELDAEVKGVVEPMGAMVDRKDWVSVTPARPEGHIPETRPELVGVLQTLTGERTWGLDDFWRGSREPKPGSDLPEHDQHTAYLAAPGQPMRRHTASTEAEAARGVGVTLPTNSAKPAYPLVQHSLQQGAKERASAAPAPVGAASKGVDGKVLSVLAGHAGPCPKRRLALLAGYSATGGAFNNILSRLRTAGWAEGSAELTITRAGRAAAGRVERPPTGRALFEWWTKHPRVDGPMNAQLWALQRAGKPVTKQELAAHCEKVTGKSHSATGGSFNNALSRLRTLGLVIDKGGQKLQLAEELRG